MIRRFKILPTLRFYRPLNRRSVRSNFYNLIFDGDSLTAFEGYVTIVRVIQTEKGDTLTVVNYAVPGQDILMMISDAPTQVDTPTNKNKPLNILSCWAGTNHIGFNRALGSTTHDTLKSYCQARRAYGFKVMVTTCLPRLDFDTSQEAQRTIFNNLIRTEWASYADALVDVASDPIMGAVATTSNKLYYADGIHFGSSGSDRLAPYFVTAIEKLLH